MLSGIDVLKNAFIKVYSDFLAREEHGYLVMTATELASLTGFNKALFENHERACVLLIGVETEEMENIVERYDKMTTKNKREMKAEVMSYCVQNIERLKENEISKDFQNIFPSVLKQISLLKKKLEKSKDCA